MLDDKIFITTPTSVRIYSVHPEDDSPLFKLDKEVFLNEWLLGANLLGIHASSRRRGIFIGNNLFNSIDELSLRGEFVQRHFLHNIAPSLFPLPEKAVTKFRYGHIRHLTENSDGTLLITVAHLNNSPDGIVINFDTGESFFTDIHTPHSCGFSDGNFIIQDCYDNTVSSYTTSSNCGVYSRDCKWKSSLDLDVTNSSKEKKFVRGLTVIEDTVYSGVWSKDDEKFPSHIISIDSKTGKQSSKRIFFPNLEKFRLPRVFFLSPLPQILEGYQSNELLFFLDGKPVEPDSHIPVSRTDKKESAADQSKAKTGKNITSNGKAPTADTNQPVQNHASVAVQSNKETNTSIAPDVAAGSPITDCAQPVQKKESASDNQKHVAEAVPGSPSIVLQNVSLSYRRNDIPFFSFKKKVSTEFKALHDISFTVHEGETVGIIGRNGSGKSTISMVISGALSPDAGTVMTSGRIQLLSIGLGFQNELSGRDNVFINGALLGLSKKEILHHLPDIENFAELEDFMDQPVRTYSAGMRSRLGFAVATAVSPDILILDEVMSTGDAAFRDKANERMKAMRQRTKTIILISHSSGQIKSMCSRVIWLHKGQVIQDGQTEDVLSSYADFCKNPKMWLATNKIRYQQP